MRISLNWIKQYLDVHETPEELSEILTSLGLEVEAVEKLGISPEKLQGVVVAEVVECWKHPNADRLSLTKVNPGSGPLLQVVCGAPNVRAGQKVLLAKEETTLHPMKGDPFTIRKGKIRGELSEGMLCAEDELGIGPSHDGILVLEDHWQPGTPAAEIFGNNGDVIYEIGLTPNRADATSHLGVARDLLAWFKVHRPYVRQLNDIPVSSLANATGTLNMEVKVHDHDLCPRYSGICLSGIEVKASPEWLQTRIRSMGLQPINNVVDVTNFVLYELGQPLHAFDYDEVTGRGIQVQTLAQGTQFTTLDSVERKLSEMDLMICDAQAKPLCMAGVFGGLHSGISDKTQNIFLESAHFNPSSVRKSSMSHNLRTQSAKCFEKGSDPNLCVFALERAVYLLQDTANAKVSSALVDVYPNKVEPAKIQFKATKAIELSGLKLDLEQFKTVLFALEMEVTDLQNGELMVFVPTNKPDVKRMADVVEEVSRVYGLDKIPLPDKIQLSFPKQLNGSYLLKREVANWLAASGLMEIMSFSMTRSSFCLQTGLWSTHELVYVNNTSNVHLDVMKPSLVLGGLETLQYNANRQQQDLALFEIGREYRKLNEQVSETEKLAIWLYGHSSPSHWISGKPTDFNFFGLKAYVEGILQFKKTVRLSLNTLNNDPLFEYGAAYASGDRLIARFGKLLPSLAGAYDLKKEVWYAEIDLSQLSHEVAAEELQFKEFSKLPMIHRDLAMVLADEIQFEQVVRIIRQNCGDALYDLRLFDIYENADQLGSGMKSYAISLTFEQQEKQMTGEEVDQTMNRLMSVCERELKAIIRR